MDPKIVKDGLDIITLLLGAYVVVQLARSAVGGTVGTAFKFILAGIIVLGVNHLLDTLYFSVVLHNAAPTDLLQAPIVHRAINLIGFVLMTIGFQKFLNAPK